MWSPKGSPARGGTRKAEGGETLVGVYSLEDGLRSRGPCSEELSLGGCGLGGCSQLLHALGWEVAPRSLFCLVSNKKLSLETSLFDVFHPPQRQGRQENTTLKRQKVCEMKLTAPEGCRTSPLSARQPPGGVCAASYGEWIPESSPRSSRRASRAASVPGRAAGERSRSSDSPLMLFVLSSFRLS